MPPEHQRLPPLRTPCLHGGACLRMLLRSSADTVDAVPLNGNSKTMFNNRMKDKDVEALVDTILSGAVVLSKLDLSYNHISDVGAGHIARMLRVRSCTTRAVAVLWRCSPCCCLPGCQDSDTYTCTVDELDLRGNSIGVEGCRAISKAMALNVSVRALNLNNNPIGNEGGMAVAAMLFVRVQTSVVLPLCGTILSLTASMWGGCRAMACCRH